jgi:type VI protein secretion system component VasK
MRRVLVMVVLVLIVTVHISGPLFETVDHWDQFPQSGNDIVLSIVLALTLFALCLCATLRLIRLVSSIFRDVKENTALTRLQNIFVPSDSLDTSSPLKLCTALRI